jgi:hypothetical protein
LLCAEGRFVGVHQSALAHGGDRLALGDLVGTFGQAQFAQSRGHGAGGDEQHLEALVDQALIWVEMAATASRFNPGAVAHCCPP